MNRDDVINTYNKYVEAWNERERNGDLGDFSMFEIRECAVPSKRRATMFCLVGEEDTYYRLEGLTLWVDGLACLKVPIPKSNEVIVYKLAMNGRYSPKKKDWVRLRSRISKQPIPNPLLIN